MFNDIVNNYKNALDNLESNYEYAFNSFCFEKKIDENNIDSVIFSKEDITFNGTGSLTITSPAGHGIVSKDELTMTSGTYTINSSSHGITGKDNVCIANAVINIISGKDGIHAENEDDASLGFIYIESGTFHIEAEGDGISATATMQIENGTFDIISGGGHENATQQTSEFWGGFGGRGPGGTKGNKGNGRNLGNNNTTTTESDSTSIKGMKATSDFIINGGTFTIDSADDSIHSNTNVTINGGMFGQALSAKKSVEDAEEIKKLREHIFNEYPLADFRFFETNTSYREYIRQEFGDIGPNFFSLFKKAIPFAPITNIEQFITDYVCDIQNNIDISAMQENIRNYTQLEVEATNLKARIEKLDTICSTYDQLDQQRKDLAVKLYCKNRAQQYIKAKYVDQLKRKLDDLQEDLKDNTEILGVNDKIQLELLTKVLRLRINQEHMRNGVTIEDSNSTYIYDDVEIGVDTVIHPNTTIKNDVIIGKVADDNTRRMISKYEKGV